eukprot:m.49659 g.49659  ORF g.49659 m.49659 type:complete len:85 (-) comp15337_c1_seq2:229-483(-)
MSRRFSSRGLQHNAKHFCRFPPPERRLLRQHFPQQHPKRPNIRSMRDLSPRGSSQNLYLRDTESTNKCHLEKSSSTTATSVFQI